MNAKSVIGIIVILIVLAIGGYYLGKPKETSAPANLYTNQNQSGDTMPQENGNNVTSQMPVPNSDSEVPEMIVDEEEDQEEPAPQSTTHSVSMTGNSFSPSTLQIKVGDTVTFANSGSAIVWPASDPHPTHTGLSGFDAQRPLEPGESWSFKFTRAGSFGYHDHLNPSVRGTIVVE